ncbi:MAG: GntR family transcriptional regulator [Hyphomicrobiaceae bacterium]
MTALLTQKIANAIVIAEGQLSLAPKAHRAMTKEDYIHAVLREGIVSGLLEPGVHLRVADIAEALGASAIPVRTALRNLARDELVTVEPHVGAYVTDMPVATLIELVEIRSVLEQYALASVLMPVDEATIDELNQLCTDMDGAIGADAPRRYARLNTAFHRIIYRLSQNKTLIDLLASLELRSERGQAAFLSNRDRMRHSVSEHREIVAALRAGKLQVARKLIDDHRNAAQRAIISVVRSQEERKNG